ncbi:cell division protein FtsX [Flaviflagellibacter deserti]|uniref:Cell division protein FtsX n=1 Tax=Flaviflagellibacter deserti TaxID=2267266 RepID=A0ABV9Z136_9HYPH
MSPLSSRLSSLSPLSPGEGRRSPPLVPGASLAGSALIVIIAIMSFLASLTVGAVDIVRDAARGWQSQVLREVTIQIRPADGRDMNAAVLQALALARATPGVTSAQAYSDAQMAALLEPWLGSGVNIRDLPTPRLIVVRTAEDRQPDLAGLRNRLSAEIPGASLDDHTAWLDRLRLTGNTLAGFGISILALVILATALSVLFATRGAVSGNKDVVEVLHFCGARDGYVARAFARRFLGLGLRGAMIGGGLAILFFLAADLLGGSGDAAGSLLFGRYSMSLSGYIGIVVLALFIGVLTAATSRLTVMAHLRRLD